MEAAQKFVDEAIGLKPVVVFSKSYCPFCVKAKKLLSDLVPESKLSVIELENRPDCNSVQAYLKELTGASSVPRVFVKGKCVGGCDDTFRLHESGDLKKQLDAALA